jgi:hemolysin activation/secretion protein
VASGIDSVPQLALRAGGVNTVRGYDYGLQQGDAMWSTQLDVRRPGRGAVKLVFFVDAGQAGRLAEFGEAEFLSSAGVGVSLLGGFIRSNLSYPLTYQQGHGVRFDLVFGGLR